MRVSNCCKASKSLMLWIGSGLLASCIAVVVIIVVRMINKEFCVSDKEKRGSLITKSKDAETFSYSKDANNHSVDQSIDNTLIHDAFVERNGRDFVISFNHGNKVVHSTELTDFEKWMLDIHVQFWEVNAGGDTYNYKINNSLGVVELEEFDDWFDIIHKHYNERYEEIEIINEHAEKIEIRKVNGFVYNADPPIPFPLSFNERQYAQLFEIWGSYAPNQNQKFKELMLYLFLKHQDKILDITDPARTQAARSDDIHFKLDEFKEQKGTLEYLSDQLDEKFRCSSTFPDMWDVAVHDPLRDQEFEVFSICGKQEHAITWKIYSQIGDPHKRKCILGCDDKDCKRWKLRVLPERN